MKRLGRSPASSCSRPPRTSSTSTSPTKRSRRSCASRPRRSATTPTRRCSSCARPAGSVYAGLAIYDTMQFIRPDVATTCVGIAMSMGALLLAAGTEGKRTALPNSKILIHQVSGGFQGQGTDIEIQARETINLKRRLEEIIAQHTNQPIDKVSKDMERDYYMTAGEAHEYGIVDNVIAH